MKNLRFGFLGSLIASLVLVAGTGLSQTETSGNKPEAKSAPESAAVRAGTHITAQLESTVDARTAKPGDEVRARVTKEVKQDGRAVIRKGDRLMGRVTSVEASGKADSGSHISAQFDRLVRGQATSSLHTVIAGVLSTPKEESSVAEPMPAEPPMPSPPLPARSSSSASGGGGLVGDLTSTVGSTVGAAGSVVGGVGGTLDATTQTTVGATTGALASTPAKAIRIHSQGQADQRAGLTSVLSTDQGHLRLESGSTLLFRVSAEGGESSTAK